MKYEIVKLYKDSIYREAEADTMKEAIRKRDELYKRDRRFFKSGCYWPWSYRIWEKELDKSSLV